MFKPLILLLILLTLVPTTRAQDEAIRLLSVQSLEEVVGEDFGLNVMYTAELSPDGTMMAWRGQDSICIFRFADEEVVCSPAPEFYRGLLNPLFWSPDSTKIAFTEDPFRLFLDSDIWVFDVATGVTTNRTEDFFYDDLLEILSDEDLANQVTVDYNPIWHPVTGELYFFRSLYDDRFDFPWTNALYRLPAKGEAELVQELTDTIPGLTVYSRSDFPFLDGAASFSPDGASLAVVLQHNDWDYLGNGIWLIDTQARMLGSANPPEKIHFGRTITGGLPTFQEPLAVTSLGWSGDGQGILIAGFDSNRTGPHIYANVYYHDLETGKQTPLTDFTDVTEQDDLLDTDELGNSHFFYGSRAAVVLNDDTVILLNADQDKGGISIAPLPPDGTGSTFLAELPDFNLYPASTSSVSSDGKVLIGGYLLTFEL